MAVNLIDSNDIKVIQSDNDIELQTDKTTLNSIINAKIKNSNTSSTTDTYSCDYIDSIKDTYSTSETLTNKVWIDNKPIYRKVINLGSWTSNNSGNNDISITQINYDTVVKLNLYVKFGDTWYNKWDIFNNITIFNPTTLRFNISTSITFADSFVIIEYTKTTD